MRTHRGLLSRLEPWLRPRRYRLDDDRYVDEITDTLLRYHEGERSLVVSYEDLGNREVGVFPDQIGPWEPHRHDDRPLNKMERERIIAAIRGAYASRGVGVADTAELQSPESGVAVLDDWNQRRASSRR